MIKYLLSIAILVGFSIESSAQCSPDPQFADSTFGVWPDTTQNLDCGYADDSEGYNQVINIKTSADTNVTVQIEGFPLTVEGYIEAFRINSVEGLPAGFVYIPDQTIWQNVGSAPPFTSVQGCVSILASQSALQDIIAANPLGQDFPLTVIVDVKIHSTNNPLANNLLSNVWLSDPSLAAIPGIGPIPVAGYKVRVRPSNTGSECAPLSTQKINSASFNVVGNFPNPFSSSTEIRFNVPSRKPVKLEVRNMVGKLVLEKNINAESGLNTSIIKSDKLIPGIYFYSINDGKQAITRRMVVSGN
ncbi:MAG: T9SS type A sorting domain-containing protein [Bacteroidia bacterium]